VRVDELVGYLGDGGVRDDVQVVAVTRSTQEGSVRAPAYTAAHRRLSRTPACDIIHID